MDLHHCPRSVRDYTVSSIQELMLETPSRFGHSLLADHQILASSSNEIRDSGQALSPHDACVSTDSVHLATSNACPVSH